MSDSREQAEALARKALRDLEGDPEAISVIVAVVEHMAAKRRANRNLELVRLK